jgi:hypothetical protein
MKFMKICQKYYKWPRKKYKYCTRHWAEKYIKNLVSKVVLQGDENHHFNPDQHVTREQFAAMVSRMFYLKNMSTTQDFVDVPQKRWSYNVVEATKDYFDAFKDLNGGFDFHPTEGAQRQDVTVTLVKVIMKLNTSTKRQIYGLSDLLEAWQNSRLSIRTISALCA